MTEKMARETVDSFGNIKEMLKEKTKDRESGSRKEEQDSFKNVKKCQDRYVRKKDGEK